MNRSKNDNNTNFTEPPPITSSNIEIEIQSPPRLNNLGNTCFVNATLQMLFRMPHFVKMLSEDSKVDKLLEKLMEMYSDPQDIRKIQILLQELENQKMIERMGPYSTSYQQADTYNFMTDLLMYVHKLSPNALDFCKWKIRAVRICQKCGDEEFYHKIDTHVAVIGIDKNLKEGDSISNSLRVNSQGRFLNVVPDHSRCEKCSHGEGFTVEQYSYVPAYSIFRISRGENLEHVFEIDRVIKLGEKREIEMDLIGVICHKGATVDSGHYISCIKNPNSEEWYYCDDFPIIVRKVSFDQVRKFLGGKSSNRNWRCMIALYKNRTIRIPVKYVDRPYKQDDLGGRLEDINLNDDQGVDWEDLKEGNENLKDSFPKFDQDLYKNTNKEIRNNFLGNQEEDLDKRNSGTDFNDLFSSGIDFESLMGKDDSKKENEKVNDNPVNIDDGVEFSDIAKDLGNQPINGPMKVNDLNKNRPIDTGEHYRLPNFQAKPRARIHRNPLHFIRRIAPKQLGINKDSVLRNKLRNVRIHNPFFKKHFEENKADFNSKTLTNQSMKVVFFSERLCPFCRRNILPIFFDINDFRMNPTMNIIAVCGFCKNNFCYNCLKKGDQCSRITKGMMCNSARSPSSLIRIINT